MTAPNGQSQARLLRSVRGARARTLESHGTGTALGDPVEVGAALGVLEDGTLCSSLKANLGHLEACAAAAGMASLLATPLKASLVAANAQLRRLNVHLLALGLAGRLSLPTSVMSCALTGHRLSSFGFSGTIAHGLIGASSNITESHSAFECNSSFRSEASTTTGLVCMRLVSLSDALAASDDISARGQLTLDARATVSSHVIGKKMIFPGVGYVEIALAEAQARSMCLTGVAITRPLLLDSSSIITLRYACTRRGEYSIASQTRGASFTVHSIGSEAAPSGSPRLSG